MKKTAEFLLEIGCEEIPAGMIPRAAEELKVILEKYLSSNGLLKGGRLKTFGAPRRLAAVCEGVLLRQEGSIREVTGPPKAVAFDNVGRPTRAAESFAQKQGVPVSRLTVVATPRGDYVAAKQLIRGRAATDLLAGLLPQAILEISWPKTMQWTGAAGPRFIRPIRWIVALLGGKRVPFAIAGLKAGRETSGHRFLGKKRIAVSNSRDYLSRLKVNGVLADPVVRRKKIEQEMVGLLKRKGLRAHSDPELLGLVTYLNEYPSVLLGDFDQGFLDLPDEILITVMRDHQKYFAVETSDGQLAPHFLAVINMDRDRSGLVRSGHERVLRSRFADARFFWQTDQRRGLGDRLATLAHVTYESRLGSYHDKVERMRRLARWLAQQWFDAGLHKADVPAADRAAELAKCDLATEMVREFTELQGIVGGLYARAQNEEEEVAWAIYDQYRPASLDDAIPRNLTGCAVMMADRLDALVGCFTVGMIPTGSSDPFALRRAALGIVKVILERKLPLSLSAAVTAGSRTLEALPPKKKVTPEMETRILDFLLDRARYVLREKYGYAYDELNAALAAGADNLLDAHNRLEAIRAIRKTKNFEPLAVAFKRIRKILEKAGPADSWRLPAVRADLLTQGAEARLHAASRQTASAAGEHKRKGNYREALQVIAGLRPAVDDFFDEVLVMAEDEMVRKNRLTLLSELLWEFSTIADFSEIVAGEAG